MVSKRDKTLRFDRLARKHGKRMNRHFALTVKENEKLRKITEAIDKKQKERAKKLDAWYDAEFAKLKAKK